MKFLDKVQKHMEIVAKRVQSFDHEVAKLTQWEYIGPIISKKTHEINKISDKRIEFLISKNEKKSFYLYLGISIIFFISGILLLINGGVILSLVLLFGGLISIFVGVFLREDSTSKVFDLDENCFCKGKKREETSLNDIVALQLLYQYTSSKKYRYPVFQLNLVLINGKRIKIMSNDNWKQFRIDVEKLSAFLNIPIWNMVIMENNYSDYEVKSNIEKIDKPNQNKKRVKKKSDFSIWETPDFFDITQMDDKVVITMTSVTMTTLISTIIGVFIIFLIILIMTPISFMIDIIILIPLLTVSLITVQKLFPRKDIITLTKNSIIYNNKEILNSYIKDIEIEKIENFYYLYIITDLEKIEISKQLVINNQELIKTIIKKWQEELEDTI